jgi:hypothetical protein
MIGRPLPRECEGPAAEKIELLKPWNLHAAHGRGSETQCASTEARP